MDIKNFQTHRSKDSSDPGFSIPGAKLRWISGKVRELSSSSGIWTPLRKSELPKELVKMLTDRIPGVFSEGDTIRRGNGELTLAYASNEAVAKHKVFLQAASKEQASRAKIMPKQEKILDGKDDFAKIETYEAEASSIPSQFLKEKNQE